MVVPVLPDPFVVELPVELPEPEEHPAATIARPARNIPRGSAFASFPLVPVANLTTVGES